MLLKKDYRKEMANAIKDLEKELTKQRYGSLSSRDIDTLILRFYKFISYHPQCKEMPQYELVRKILGSLTPGHIKRRKYRELVLSAMEIINRARADLSRGIKACPYCSAEMPIEANYCGVCGKNLHNLHEKVKAIDRRNLIEFLKQN